MTPEDCRDALRSLGLNPGAVQRLGSGWDSACFATSDGWVARFPLNDSAVPGHGRAVALLERLSGHDLSLPVPRVAHLGTFAARPFLVYRRLPGEPHPDWLRCDDEVTARIGAQLGGFLRRLHALPLEAAERQPSLFIETLRAAESTLGALAANLRPAVVAAVRRDLGRLVALVEQDVSTCVVLHGDLEPDNVLLAEQIPTPSPAEPGAVSLVVSGIIDFADTGVGDPAFDFRLLATAAPRLLDAALAAYDPAVLTGSFRQRLALYARLAPLHAATGALALGRDEDVRGSSAALAERFG